MHELQAAIQIIEMVRKEMDRRKFTEIGRIGVRIGALSGFNPDALVFSFDAAAAETPLSNTPTGHRIRSDQSRLPGLS